MHSKRHGSVPGQTIAPVHACVPMHSITHTPASQSSQVGSHMPEAGGASLHSLGGSPVLELEPWLVAPSSALAVLPSVLALVLVPSSVAGMPVVGSLVVPSSAVPSPAVMPADDASALVLPSVVGIVAPSAPAVVVSDNGPTA